MDKNIPDLKVTGVKNVPAWAMAKIPITIRTIITDVVGDRYQLDIDMDNGWDEKGFRDATVIGFQLCDNTPSAVHVEYVIKRNTGFANTN